MGRDRTRNAQTSRGGSPVEDFTETAQSQEHTTELPLVSSAVVPQGDTANEDIRVPKDGRLTDVYLSFPAGANQSLAMGIRGVDNESLIPYGPKDHKYIALSDTVVQFSLDYRVEKGENLTVEYVNNRPPENDEDGFLTAILVVTEGCNE